MLSALQYTHRTSRSPWLTVSGAPHSRQLGDAPGAEGGAAAKAAPTLAAPLTRISFMPTIAARAWIGMSGNQIPAPLMSGRALRMYGQASAATRTAASPPLISIKGAQAAQMNHQRGMLIWFKRDHSRSALRVAASSSRVRRNSSRYCGGIELLFPQNGHAIDEASATARGALQELH